MANHTAGLRDCIENGITGSIANCNDPVALANLLKQSGENLNLLQNMGMAALKQARSLTHQQMHRQRWQLLLIMGAIKKVGDTYSRAIAPACQIGTT